GGFGGAPKFPHPMDLRVLLRVWKRFGDDDALAMVTKTLDGMARGGMYDHLGGGFHRYSTDERWLVPHFEKMLYDNALLTVAYVEAYQATGRQLYRDVAEETLDFVIAEMTSAEGGFFSTQDADSEGVEGKFFVWSKAEIEQILRPEVAKVFCSVYDVTPEGNWEGHNILNRSRSYEVEAKMLGIAEPELLEMLWEGKKNLLEVRSKRVWPGRDEKILTSWNGLMMTAFARAGQALQRSDYVARGLAALDFVSNNLTTREGRLLRTCGAGSKGKLTGYLEDYAFLLEGMIALYEASWMGPCLARALALADVMIDQFWDPAEGGFFYTARDHETLIARTKDQHDSSIPSGNGLAATALLRLAKITGRGDLEEKAVKTLQLFRGLMESSPMAAGQMLTGLDFHLGPVEEIVIVGNPRAAETCEVLKALYGKFRPNHVLATRFVGDQPEWDTSIEDKLPLLTDKEARGPVTTYICRDYACEAPLVGVEAAVAAFR
ncbi:MAG TPA: thioredoxin domain-containing protein, partial [Gemmataceae bacterium]|nr:thioredoxin domain-containing protein [Gemmataceae bacterium]